MYRYVDRFEAGEILAAALVKSRADLAGAVVLALPRGGVPIAYKIAQQLSLPLNIFLVRKLGIPGHEESAMGAIAEKNICILNHDVIEQLHISNIAIQQVIQKEKQELQRRLQCYRQGQDLPKLQQKTVILVDDGIATGATMKAAIESLRSLQPQKIVLAIPVASKESVQALKPLVDQFICPLVPEPFYGVGRWYEDFPQTSDKEVIDLLKQAETFTSIHKAI